ncbi:MAG: RNA polymerase sigma factor [Phycisphaerales bacterium JB040]
MPDDPVRTLADFSEQELVDLVLLGDRAAATEFFERQRGTLRKRVGGQLGRRVRRVHDSGDLLSSVLRRLNEQVGRGRVQARDARSLMSYINGVSRNTVRRRIRDAVREERAIGRLSRGEAVTPADGGPDRPSDPHADSLMDSFMEAKASLSERDREVIDLYLRHGEAAKVGAALGLSPESTRQALSRARKRLSEAIRERA